MVLVNYKLEEDITYGCATQNRSKNQIISLSPTYQGIPDPSEKEYIGKTGIINYIDDAGTIWGTWGGIGILPCDNYEIINKEGE